MTSVHIRRQTTLQAPWRFPHYLPSSSKSPQLQGQGEASTQGHTQVAMQAGAHPGVIVVAGSTATSHFAVADFGKGGEVRDAKGWIAAVGGLFASAVSHPPSARSFFPFIHYSGLPFCFACLHFLSLAPSLAPSFPKPCVCCIDISIIKTPGWPLMMCDVAQLSPNELAPYLLSTIPIHM